MLPAHALLWLMSLRREEPCHSTSKTGKTPPIQPSSPRNQYRWHFLPKHHWKSLVLWATPQVRQYFRSRMEFNSAFHWHHLGIPLHIHRTRAQLMSNQLHASHPTICPLWGLSGWDKTHLAWVQMIFHRPQSYQAMKSCLSLLYREYPALGNGASSCSMPALLTEGQERTGSSYTAS